MLVGMRSLRPLSTGPSSTRLALSARNGRSSSHEDTVLASGDNETPWAVDQDRRPSGLRVVLPKRTYVLACAQFLYAEGG
jgi:hypothetical protein